LGTIIVVAPSLVNDISKLEGAAIAVVPFLLSLYHIRKAPTVEVPGRAFLVQIMSDEEGTVVGP
jgi:hypothetical protein